MLEDAKLGDKAGFRYTQARALPPMATKGFFFFYIEKVLKILSFYFGTFHCHEEGKL